MRTSMLATIAFTAFVTTALADVAHLPHKEYLPPPPMATRMFANDGAAAPSSAAVTSIEKQELHELPEQIEFMPTATNGDEALHVDNMLMPPMPMEEMQPPPLPQTAAAPAQQYLMAAAPAMAVAGRDVMPVMRQYLAPRTLLTPPITVTAMPEETIMPATMAPQLNYLQYLQEEMRHQHDAAPMLSMKTAADAEVPMPTAPSDEQIARQRQEPQPAHMLTVDGYFYQTGRQHLPQYY